jgi:alpha-glucosidase
MIGEIAYSTNPTDIVGFIRADEGELIHLPFNFALIMLDWNAEAIRDFVLRYEAALPPDGQPNYVMGNHDMERLASRIGSEQARVAAMLMLTVGGTPFIYQGEELGMTNGEITPEQYQDPQGINMGVSRDFERTPMQWNSEIFAGFSTASPWLPVASNYKTVNVESEQADPRSMLNLYRQLIQLRRSHPALTIGKLSPLESPQGTFAYLREHEGEKLIVALNFTGEEKRLDLGSGEAQIAISTHLDQPDQVDLSAVHLRAHEGLLIKT